MNCLKPVPIRNPAWLDGDVSASRWLLVPCGKCPLCLSKKRREWAFRIKQHSKKCNNGFFVTLTYDNAFLPLDSNGIAHVSKRDCQTFLKRFRKYISRYERSRPLSYYLCSEYGPETLRPHYHLLLFDVPDYLNSEKRLYEVLMKTWKLGFVQCGFLQDGGGAYVCKYLMHPVEDFPDYLTKPFSLMSKGIGKEYVTPQIVDYFYSRGTYMTKENGHDFALPRYLRKKIFTDEELSLISKEIVDKLRIENVKEINKYIHDYFAHQSRMTDLATQKLQNKSERIKKNLKSKHKLSNL